MKKEYDFSGGVRGKYVGRMAGIQRYKWVEYNPGYEACAHGEFVLYSDHVAAVAPKKSREWPTHELANYRIALEKFRKSNLTSDWEKVRGNALRLAEAVDEIDRKGKQ